MLKGTIICVDGDVLRKCVMMKVKTPGLIIAGEMAVVVVVCNDVVHEERSFLKQRHTIVDMPQEKEFGRVDCTHLWNFTNGEFHCCREDY